MKKLRLSDFSLSPAGALCLVALCLAALPAGAQTWSRVYAGDEWRMPRDLTLTSDGGALVVGGLMEGEGLQEENAWILKVDADGLVEWERIIGGEEHDGARAAVELPGGGFAVVGYEISSGDAGENVWILHLGADGSLLGQQRIGGPMNDWAAAVEATSDGGLVVVGSTESFGQGQVDLWVVKLDSLLAVDWQNTYGGREDDLGTDVVVLPDRGYLVSGYTKSSPVGEHEGLLLRLDRLGAVVWQQALGGPESDTIFSAEQAADGGFILGVETCCRPEGWAPRVVKTNATGGIEWQKRYGDYGGLIDVIPVAGGGYLLTGYAGTEWDGVFDLLAVKMDGTGGIEWRRRYGGAGMERGWAVRESAGGWFFVAGETASFDEGAGPDAWLLRTDTAGEIEGTCAFIREAIFSAFDASYEMNPTTLTAEPTRCRPVPTTATGGDGAALLLRQCEDTPCVADPFEEDDTCGQAPAGIAPGENQARNFCEDTNDWVALRACRGRDYVVETSGLGPMTDTVLDLYAPDCATLLATHDNVAPRDWASRLEWTAPGAGTYWLRVRQGNGWWGQGHQYDLSLLGDPSPCPDPPTEVSPPGSVQPLAWTDKHTLIWAPAGESGSSEFNLYRGTLEDLASLLFGTCLQIRVTFSQAFDFEVPPAGKGWFYLVAGVNDGGEGPLGSMLPARPRPNDSPCP